MWDKALQFSQISLEKWNSFNQLVCKVCGLLVSDGRVFINPARYIYIYTLYLIVIVSAEGGCETSWNVGQSPSVFPDFTGEVELF